MFVKYDLSRFFAIMEDAMHSDDNMDNNIDKRNGYMTDKEFTLHLISIYRKMTMLWKTTSKEYTDKNKRKEAMKKMTNLLKLYRHDITKEEVKKKINILRTGFKREFNKVKKSKLSDTDSPYVPTLWYYKELDFLEDQIKEKQRRDSENTDAEDNKLMYITSQLDPLEMPTSIEIRNKKRRRTDQNTSKERTFLELSDHDDSENQEEYHLARLWASKLRKLAPIQKLLAEKAVNDILFEAALGNLNHSSVKINEPIRSKSPSPTESKAPTVYFIPSSDKSPSRRYYKTSSNPSAGTSNHVDFSN